MRELMRLSNTLALVWALAQFGWTMSVVMVQRLISLNVYTMVGIAVTVVMGRMLE